MKARAPSSYDSPYHAISFVQVKKKNGKKEKKETTTTKKRNKNNKKMLNQKETTECDIAICQALPLVLLIVVDKIQDGHHFS